MTATELIYKIVLYWNRLPHPQDDDAAQQAGVECAAKLAGVIVDTTGATLAACSEALNEADEMDNFLLFLIAVSSQLDHDFLKFVTYTMLGSFLVDEERDSDSAVAVYEQVRDLWFDRLGEQFFHGNIGLAYMGGGDYRTGIDELESAMAIARARGDEESLGIYQQNAGVAHRALGNLDEAQACYEQALAISEKLNDSHLATRKRNLLALEADIRARRASEEQGVSADRPLTIVRDGAENRSARHLTYTRPLKVFLCYASEDGDIVKGLHDRLASDSVQVWMDRTRLRPGQNWDREIMAAINHVDLVILCVSSASLAKPTYVQEEVRTALDRASGMPPGDVFIVPLKVRPCSLPDRLAVYHWVDYFAENGFDQLLASLHDKAMSLGIA